MVVISMADFINNPKYKSAPCRIVENGIEIGTFFPKKESFLKRFFSKKDNTIDGIHKPSRQLKAALRESKRMEKHPERYKTYNDLGEVFEELGIKA